MTKKKSELSQQISAAAFESVMAEAVQEADVKPEVVEPLEKALQLIQVLHERVKRLEEAKGWHDAAACVVFAAE